MNTTHRRRPGKGARMGRARTRTTGIAAKGIRIDRGKTPLGTSTSAGEASVATSSVQR